MDANFEQTSNLEQNPQDSQGTPDASFSQVPSSRGRERLRKIRNQGCSTIICGIVIIVVILLKVKDLSFKDATSKWIDYGSQEEQSVAELKIFPTKDSYTAILNCNGSLYMINCADNLAKESLQSEIGGKDPEVLFLVSDGTEFLKTEPKKVYATSKLSEDYYNNGEFFESEIGLPGAKLDFQLQNDTLKIHCRKGNKVFKVHFSNGKSDSSECDVLINSTKKDLSALAQKTYLDQKCLRNYEEITIDLIDGKVYAD